MKKLNLASGTKYFKGWTNVDIDKNVNANVYCDLNKLPFPFKNNTFDEIYCNSFLEHTTLTIPEFLLECKRILKRNGVLTLVFPNSWWWRNRLDFLTGIFVWRKVWSPYHFNQLVKPSWVKIIARSIGFDVKEEKNCNGLTGFLFRNNIDLRESVVVLDLRKME